MDRSEFVLRWGPKQDDTPGGLSFGGYLSRHVTVTEEKYGPRGNTRGEALVEVVHHSAEYPHVLHDFFGTFRAAAHAGRGVPLDDRKAVGGVVEEQGGRWQFVDWGGSETPAKGGLCYTAGSEGKAGGGIVGWYAKDGERVTTVLIRFGGLAGVPSELIDRFLEQYPSSVLSKDYRGDHWVEEDARKYMDLLRRHQSDWGMLGLIAARLAQFDASRFGVREALAGQQTPKEFDEAIEGVIDRMEIWLKEREQAKAPKGG